MVYNGAIDAKSQVRNSFIDENSDTLFIPVGNNLFTHVALHETPIHVQTRTSLGVIGQGQPAPITSGTVAIKGIGQGLNGGHRI